MLQVCFFPHGNINLVGFRVETMALQKHLLDLFILDLHLKTWHEVVVLWCGFLLVLGLRCFVCLCGFCLVFKIFSIIVSMKNEI